MKHLLTPSILFLLLTLQGLTESLDLTSGYPLYLFNCSKDGNFTPNSFYQYSLYNLLNNLSSHASSDNGSGFYYTSMGQDPTKAYASYLCRGDVPPHTCSECVHNATQMVVSVCPYQTGGTIWYIECMFQYSNEPYWGLIQDRFKLLMWNAQNMSSGEVAGFAKRLSNTLGELAVLAVNDGWPGRLFGTKVAEVGGGIRLYTLAC